jgi:solute:Na+ symporter, SSS family
MHTIDYIVIGVFALLMVLIGLSAVKKIKGSKDFFVGGGKVPWWLAGVSLHVSSYSAVIFVAWGALAYQYGFTLYIWWGGTSVLSSILAAYVFAPRWARLRIKSNIESPTEYLATRYSITAQQTMAWTGVTLKVFDVGAKWAAIGALVHGFTGLPFATGVLLSGAVSLIYVTAGGLWGDLYTNFAQFIVQVLGGLVLFFAVLRPLGGAGSILGIWSRLPKSHTDVFNGPFSPLFCIGYVAAAVLSGGGGTWNQAARYIAAPTGRSAKQSALLCGLLFAIWPLILFFPLWGAPLLFPGLADPTQVYPMLVLRFLPSGLVGLVLAACFASTMSMCSSDTNTISAVITRDMLPFLSPRFRNMSPRRELMVARVSTLFFLILTVVLALEAEHFGGVLGLTISWFFALIGPISIPMLCGLLPLFKYADSNAAIASIFVGLAGFLLATYGLDLSQPGRVAAPIVCSMFTFSLMAWMRRAKSVPHHVEELMAALSGTKKLQS